MSRVSGSTVALPYRLCYREKTEEMWDRDRLVLAGKLRFGRVVGGACLRAKEAVLAFVVEIVLVLVGMGRDAASTGGGLQLSAGLGWKVCCVSDWSGSLRFYSGLPWE